MLTSRHVHSGAGFLIGAILLPTLAGVIFGSTVVGLLVALLVTVPAWLLSHEAVRPKTLEWSNALAWWGRRNKMISLATAISVGALFGAALFAGAWLYGVRQLQRQPAPPPTAPGGSNPPPKTAAAAPSEIQARHDALQKNPEYQKRLAAGMAILERQRQEKAKNESQVPAVSRAPKPVSPVSGRVRPTPHTGAGAETPPAAQPNLADIRIASQERVVSADPKFPYALEVVIQTNQNIQPVAFALECDGQIGSGTAGYRGGGAYNQVKTGLADGHNNVFVFEWDTPAFTPAKPIVVTLFSAGAIRAQRLHKIDYSWP